MKPTSQLHTDTVADKDKEDLARLLAPPPLMAKSLQRASLSLLTGFGE